jgi:hypothetical protein
MEVMVVGGSLIQTLQKPNLFMKSKYLCCTLVIALYRQYSAA